MRTIKPSVFAETYLNINFTMPFSFDKRHYWIPIYDSPARMELFKTGRQCAKSTFLANRIITRAITIAGLQVLYEAPKSEQSSVFSYQKITPILMASKKLRPFLKLRSTGKIEGIAVQKYTCFKSGAFLKLSTTFNGADRDRGISINDLYIDETQDQIEEDINVLSEGLSASSVPPYMAFAGTPKSEDNYIEKLWQKSRQNVWMVRCEGCNTWQLPGRDHIEKTIQERGLLCWKCEKKLNMLNGWWVSENPAGKYNGWHISQLMRLVKGMKGGINWTDELQKGVYDKYRNYQPHTFYNEVLGFSYDSAEKPITMDDLRNAAIPSLKKQTAYDPTTHMTPIVMGIDWAGTNTDNYTVVSISCMYKSSPTLIYMRKFSGPEADPQVTASIIYELVKKFGVTAVYCDNGLFWHVVHEMHRRFGPDLYKLFNFVIYGNPKELIQRAKKPKDDRKLLLVNRNELLHLFVSHLKQSNIKIYNFTEFTKDEFHYDYLAISYEVRNTEGKGEQLFFMNSADTPQATDCFHSHLYSWVGLGLETYKFKYGIFDAETY